ncbi:MAG: hypothetical protein MR896_02955 [Clostridiales bacterium]|nr:hypothetical protein [Clostridiales bacterium]
MKIKFPRGVEVDIDKVPEDFEEQIRKSFQGYTEGTAKAYQYQDKLSYIDLCRRYAHGNNSYDWIERTVSDLIKDTFCDRFDEFGEFVDESEFLSVRFMETCCEAGSMNLYSNYTNDHHKDDKIMKLLERAIKVVINYEED